MSLFAEQIVALNEAIKEQYLHEQMCIIGQILHHLEQAENHMELVQVLLSLNFAITMNNVISTQMIILHPSMKILTYLMEDYHFRVYLFSPILKNVLRVLAFIVQSEEVKCFQLELFDVIDILDNLLERYVAEIIARNVKEDLAATFLCLLELTKLILSKKSIKTAVKYLMSQIFLHSLMINGIFHYTTNNFEVIMKVSNISEEFLKRFAEEYKRNNHDLWLFKILEMLLKIFESLILGSPQVEERSFRVYESVFASSMIFVLERLTAFQFELFNLLMSIFNTILWTPGFSRHFYLKMLKKFIKLHRDSRVFLLAQTSSATPKQATYMMKIFLTALVEHSSRLSLDKYQLLDTFLQGRLYDSITHISPERVMKNHRLLIALYGCALLRDELSGDARQILENLVWIMNEPKCQLDEDEIWELFKTFAFYSRYAPLSELEYVGVGKVIEIIIGRAYKSVMDIQKFRYDIDKYVLAVTEVFHTDRHFINTLIFLYLSQEPSVTSSKVSQIIPTSNVLPLLVSNDCNQVENAVKMLQNKPLTECDLNFIIVRNFDGIKNQEITIGAALSLINANMSLISIEDSRTIYKGTIEFLQAKRIAPKFTKECYILLVRTCSNLIRSKTRLELICQSQP